MPERPLATDSQLEQRRECKPAPDAPTGSRPEQLLAMLLAKQLEQLRVLRQRAGLSAPLAPPAMEPVSVTVARIRADRRAKLDRYISELAEQLARPAR